MDEAIIGLIGALIGSTLTFIVGALTLRYNYLKLYAEMISSSRNEWINIWRDELSKFLSITDILRYEVIDKYKTNELNDNNEINSSERQYYLSLIKEYHISKNKILMRLNLNEKMHQEVYLLINKISYEKGLDNKEYFKLKEVLLNVSRDLLKDEWERVKQEAKGRK